MGVILLDTSAIIAFLEPTDALHASAVRRIVELDMDPQTRFVASAVSFMEVLVGAGRGHSGEAVIRRFFARMTSEILPFDHTTAEHAAELRAAWKLRTPDAMILATADRRGADLILTGDARWSRTRGLAPRVELLGS